MAHEPAGWTHGYHQLSPEAQQELYLQLMSKQELLRTPDYQRWLQNELDVTGRGLDGAQHQLETLLPEQLLDAQIGHVGESAQEILQAFVNDAGQVAVGTVAPGVGKGLNIVNLVNDGPVGLLPFSNTGQELVEAGAEFPTTESIGIDAMETWRDTLQQRHDQLSAESSLTPEQLEGHLEELRSLDPGLRDLDAQASERASDQLNQVHESLGWKAMQQKESVPGGMSFAPGAGPGGGLGAILGGGPLTAPSAEFSASLSAIRAGVSQLRSNIP